MKNAHDCIVICEGMERRLFFENIVQGVSKMPEFSHLMCCGEDQLELEEKHELCSALQKVGVPADFSPDDTQLGHDLADICHTISNRMLKLA